MTKIQLDKWTEYKNTDSWRKCSLFHTKVFLDAIITYTISLPTKQQAEYLKKALPIVIAFGIINDTIRPAILEITKKEASNVQGKV